MTAPANQLSLDAATAAGVGETRRVNGHYHLSLFVAVDGTLDTANDTLDVALEGSPDGSRWHTLTTVSATDFEQDNDSGEYTALAAYGNQYIEFIRARLVAISDASGGDLGSVDAYVLGGGFAGQGTKGVPLRP